MDVVADSVARRTRAGIPAARWTSRRDPAILTAIANDIGVEAIFTRQVIAHGAEGDALLADLHQRQLRERDRGAARPAGGA